MLKFATAVYVFLGGFAIMVLEIVGARFLLKDFGGSIYVWTSQIGVILVALSLGYAIGGALADRYKRTGFLAAPLACAALFICLIPNVTPPVLERIVMRHPPEAPIPMLWLKLDPALGSTLVFFLPCFVLATLSPYMIRIAARQLDQVGTISGLIYASSTVGSVAGVFASGYILIDYFSVPQIFRMTGALTFVLAILSLIMNRWMAETDPGPDPTASHGQQQSQ